MPTKNKKVKALQNQSSNRNEDTSQYFEKVFAAKEFTELLKPETKLSSVDIKPDRNGGAKRRIEDITRFFEDKSIEVIQLKYSNNEENKWVYSDLWQTKKTIKKKEATRDSKYEGEIIFKFLKSWRFHKGFQGNVKLLLVSNKPLGIDLNNFFSDIKKLKKNTLSWISFSTTYSEEIENIKSNFLKTRLKQGELESFLKSFEFRISKDIDELYNELGIDLSSIGISDKDRVDAFLARTFKKFTQNQVSVQKADVKELIEIIKTSLIHEVGIPKNFIQRKLVEDKILDAIERRKKKGGFVFLFSPSGSGKTILLSSLTRKNEDFLPYLCRIRSLEKINSEKNYEEERLSSLWFKVDLIQRFFELGLTKETLSLKDNEANINLVFERVLKQASDTALKRKTKKIVVIVDALDQVETDKYTEKSILSAIPPIQYPGIVFLLSTWTKEYLPQQIKNLPTSAYDKFSISLAFSEKETEEYFTSAEINLTPDQIRKILKKTKGLAISNFYLLQKIKKIPQKDYDLLINSDEDYKEVFDWYKPIWDGLNKDQKHCLGCLSFHFAEVQRNTLYKIAKINFSNFSTLNEKISPFVNLRGGYVEPYHDSFRRFIRKKLKGLEKDYHKELVSFYSKKGYIDQTYSKKFITSHFEGAGKNDSSVIKITKSLIKNSFVEKILSSKLDYSSKLSSVRYFIKYFEKNNKLENFIKYSIEVSNLNPDRHSNNDVYIKAEIGTPNLIKEVENELSVIENNNLHTLREWTLKRIRIGNILYNKNDIASKKLGAQFLEDSIARISFNRDILWGQDVNEDIYWSNILIYLEANINLGRYKSVTRYVSNIRFKKPTPFTVGFKASLLTKLNRVQYKVDKKSVLEFIQNTSKATKLICCSYLFLEQGEHSISGKLKALFKEKTLYKYLINDREINQSLDLAEVACLLNIGDLKNSISKLISKLEFDPPYHRDMYSSWGMNDRNLFLKKAALLYFVDPKFKPKEFFIETLKKHHKDHYKDYENDTFANIVEMYIELHKNILLVKAKKAKWNVFDQYLNRTILIFKNEIKKANEYKDLTQYPLRDSAYIYYQNLNSFLIVSLNAVGTYFSKNLEKFTDELVLMFQDTILKENEAFIELIFESLLPINSSMKSKIESYQKKLLDLKTKEKSDNIAKSDSLKELAKWASCKGYGDTAEDIYKEALKYSKGLSAKEDLRVFNMIDCLRTRSKKEDFDLILKYIDDIGDAVEGTWYYRLSFLGSVAYSNYETSLDYLFDFTNQGETNLNEGLRKIVDAIIKNYKFKETIGDLLVLLDILRFDEEGRFTEQTNVQGIYYALISFSLESKDINIAKKLVSKYIIYLQRNIYIEDRLNLLKEFTFFLKNKLGLNQENQDIKKYISEAEVEGYSIAKSSNTKYELIPNSDVIQINTSIKNKSTKKIIKLLNDCLEKDQKYKIDDLIAKIIPKADTSLIDQIKSWCQKNKIDFNSYPILCALVEFAIKNKKDEFLKKAKKDILYLSRNSEPYYGLPEIIKRLANIEFIGKKEFIKKVLLSSILKTTESSHSLNYLLIKVSEVIDDYYPEIKKFAYEPLKKTVEASMKLSLSKV